MKHFKLHRLTSCQLNLSDISVIKIPQWFILISSDRWHGSLFATNSIFFFFFLVCVCLLVSLMMWDEPWAIRHDAWLCNFSFVHSHMMLLVFSWALWSSLPQCLCELPRQLSSSQYAINVLLIIQQYFRCIRAHTRSSTLATMDVLHCFQSHAADLTHPSCFETNNSYTVT